MTDNKKEQEEEKHTTTSAYPAPLPIEKEEQARNPNANNPCSTSRETTASAAPSSPMNKAEEINNEEDINPTNTTPSSKTEPSLPPLSPTDFNTYNRLATHMQHYHTQFRTTWSTLYTAASTGHRPPNLSLSQFISLGLSLCTHLTIHHQIEETAIFPLLATKMPAFRETETLLRQHGEIHEGLEELEMYLSGVRRGERELVMGELKGIMDGFGGVLWAHLDDEVRELGAENMRRFWSVEEVRGLGFF